MAQSKHANQRLTPKQDDFCLTFAGAAGSNQSITRLAPGLFEGTRRVTQQISEERQFHHDCIRSGVRGILRPTQTAHLLHLALHFPSIRRLLYRHAQKPLTPGGLHHDLLIEPSYYRCL